MEGRSSADRRGGRYHVILCVVIGEMTLSTCLLCRLLTQDENQSPDVRIAGRCVILDEYLKSEGPFKFDKKMRLLLYNENKLVDLIVGEGTEGRHRHGQ